MRSSFGGDYSTACAYMLMYKRYRPDEPPAEITDEMIPASIREEIEAEREKLLEQQREA